MEGKYLIYTDTICKIVVQPCVKTDLDLKNGNFYMNKDPNLEKSWMLQAMVVDWLQWAILIGCKWEGSSILDLLNTHKTVLLSNHKSHD